MYVAEREEMSAEKHCTCGARTTWFGLRLVSGLARTWENVYNIIYYILFTMYTIYILYIYVKHMVLRCDLFGFMISYVPAADDDETTL